MTHTFSQEAERAIHLIEYTSQSVFVTGKAGTGKSTLLDYIRNHTTKKIAILAPTGISAINVNGDTIHAFFKLKPGFELDEARRMRIDDKKKKKYQALTTIAIDEISMVRADLLDAIDTVLRRARDSDEPFGGVQMVFFGDLYQLPPVVTRTDEEMFSSLYPSPYFFDAQVFRGQERLFSAGFDLTIIELTDIYRQSDREFIDILNAVRNNTVEDHHLNTLNARFNPNFIPSSDEKYIYLMTTNAGASVINDRELKKLDGLPTEFRADITGSVPSSLYPNDTSISLSVGSQIMFVANDPERRWVNGTIGTVIDIKKTFDAGGIRNHIITVEKSDGIVVKVTKHVWEISRYIYTNGKFEREITGSYTQIPLRLAWAITIHKSQGKTFDRVIVDLGRGSFAHGQTYVALSRCTSLEGLVLKTKLARSSIIMDDRVSNFWNTNSNKY
jgi:ATP-dependent DNA helicase PIF1